MGFPIVWKIYLKKKRFLLRTSNGNGSINGMHRYFDTQIQAGINEGRMRSDSCV